MGRDTGGVVGGSTGGVVGESTGGVAGESTGGEVHRATESRGFEAVARTGYLISGVLHVLVGALAVRLALGDDGVRADQSGALAQLADRPLGGVVLWLGVLGFAALGVERLAEGLWGPARGRRIVHLPKTAGKGLLYLAAAWTTSTFARGGRSSSAEQVREVAQALLGTVTGRVLLAVLGGLVVGAGVYHLVKGARRRFLADLVPGAAARPVVVLGVVGYLAKGLALVVVGVLFVEADLRSDASAATGLDGALSTLGEQRGGPVLLGAVGLGFVAYGLYSFARARLARM